MQCDDSSVSQTYRVTVRAVTNLNARMRRVTVGSDSLAGFAPWPGQDVVLHLTSADGAGVRRRYTVRSLDPGAHTFDVDFVRHGHGPGAIWAENARPGDEVEIFGPRGKVPVSDAAWQLFAGDESALPAIAEIVQALPSRTTVTALIEVTDSDDEQPLKTAAALDVRWIHRAPAAAGTSDALDRAVEQVAVPDDGRHVYLFGESRAVRRLRDLVSARGVPPVEISAKGYWNLGRDARD
ncbi:MAG: siderophore-interacting protein [Acidothermaceae bacterium]